jgi:hypothetical protein
MLSRGREGEIGRTSRSYPGVFRVSWVPCIVRTRFFKRAPRLGQFRLLEYVGGEDRHPQTM